LTVHCNEVVAGNKAFLGIGLAPFVEIKPLCRRQEQAAQPVGCRPRQWSRSQCEGEQGMDKFYAGIHYYFFSLMVIMSI
jgi:hypothetical protein